MTLEELNIVINRANIPVAYLAFPADQAPQMPFIVYQEVGSDNFGADNIVWHSAMRVQIDLYCRKKSRATDQLLENVLTEAGIFWEREVSFNEDEDCYRSLYDIEI